MSGDRNNLYTLGAKRALDLVLVVPGLVVLSPILVLLWALCRLRLGRPALFRQDRPGLGGKSFCLLKFRTMTDERAPDGGLRCDAERLTSFGRFLRRTSLDELPELINVLKGEMSLVGPRPLLVQYLPYYTTEQARRHDVRPGITGWAQVNGRNEISWEEKFELDVWYVDHISLRLDFIILARTLAKVVAREGVEFHEPASMPFFTGTPASSVNEKHESN
jgi:lipopolysaccharide/colanic/teichoic acid biosynthesis glycosyltransferase